MKEKKRLANIEMLRIISMLMVVMWHLLGHGNIIGDNEMPIESPYIGAWILKTICISCINLYVLISGYFLTDSQFHVKKLITILVETIFYSILLFGVSCVMGLTHFTFDEALRSVLPTITRKYWFVSVYVSMYVLFPFLNQIINHITQKQHLYLIGILVILFVLLPNSMLAFGGGMSLDWFITLYFIAAYIKRYYKQWVHNGIMVLIYCGSIIMLLASKLFTSYFYKYNSILVLISSVSLFMIFIHISVKSESVSRVITGIAPLTFGIYLIHDNVYVRNVLWPSIGLANQLGKWYFVLYIIAATFVVFICCCVIEWIRSVCFDMIGKGYSFVYRHVKNE